VSHYAKISDLKKTRIALLEAAKEPVVLLSQQKIFNDLKKQKYEKVSEIESEFNDLINIIKKLDRILPEKDLRIEAKKLKKVELEKELKAKTEETKKNKKSTTKKTSKPASKPLTDVDRLEYTLSKIEQKLASLK